MSDKFEMHCIVEIFGHTKIAGKVSEQTVAGQGFIRVDVPKTKKRDGFTRLYGTGAIYAMTPVSEEIAALMAERLEVQAVSEWTLSEAVRKLLPATALAGDDDDTGYETGHNDWYRKLHTADPSYTGEPNELPDERFFPDDENEDDDDDDDEPAFSPFNTANETELMVDPEALRVTRKSTEPEVPLMPIESGSTIEADEYDYLKDKRAHCAAAQWARELLKGEFVILDTETTGLNNVRKDEPVQIAVIDQNGMVLLDTLIKPSFSIPWEATGIHGITDEMVATAPAFSEIRDRLTDLLRGKPLVIYNADYDKQILVNAHRTLGGLFAPAAASAHHCAMEQYAQFYGEWNDYHGNYRWQSLGNACRQQNVPFVGPAHSALGDCQATLALIKKMAEFEAEQPAAATG